MKIIKFIASVAVILYLGSLTYVLVYALHRNVPKHADAIVVLGAKVNLNNSPSDPLKNRTAEAVKLYNQGIADYLITTGGVGLGSEAEAQNAADLAAASGVPREKILSESNSHNTLQNLDDIKDIADQKNIKSLIVVSDNFHVARGVLFARHFGFKPVYWDYPNPSYYSNQDLVRNYFREAAAIIYYAPTIIWR